MALLEGQCAKKHMTRVVYELLFLFAQVGIIVPRYRKARQMLMSLG